MYEFKRLDLVEERIDKVEDRSEKLHRMCILEGEGKGEGGREGERMNKSWKKVHLERVPQIDSRVDRMKVVIEEMKKYFKRKISHI